MSGETKFLSAKLTGILYTICPETSATGYYWYRGSICAVFKFTRHHSTLFPLLSLRPNFAKGARKCATSHISIFSSTYSYCEPLKLQQFTEGKAPTPFVPAVLNDFPWQQSSHTTATFKPLFVSSLGILILEFVQVPLNSEGSK